MLVARPKQLSDIANSAYPDRVDSRNERRGTMRMAAANTPVLSFPASVGQVGSWVRTLSEAIERTCTVDETRDVRLVTEVHEYALEVLPLKRTCLYDCRNA